MKRKHPLAINGMHHVSLRVHDMERHLSGCSCGARMRILVSLGHAALHTRHDCLLQPRALP